jgi:hypothetical protein
MLYELGEGNPFVGKTDSVASFLESKHGLPAGIQEFNGIHIEPPTPHADAIFSELLETKEEIWKKVPGLPDQHQVENQRLSGFVNLPCREGRLDDEGPRNISIQAEALGLMGNCRREDQCIGTG